MEPVSGSNDPFETIELKVHEDKKIGELKQELTQVAYPKNIQNQINNSNRLTKTSNIPLSMLMNLAGALHCPKKTPSKVIYLREEKNSIIFIVFQPRLPFGADWGFLDCLPQGCLQKRKTSQNVFFNRKRAKW